MKDLDTVKHRQPRSVWIIEDDARYAARIRTAIKLSFPHVATKTLTSVSAVNDALVEEQVTFPDLVILDMILQGSPPGQIGGVLVWESIREAHPDVPILISTSEPALIPARIHDEHTFTPPKTDLEGVRALIDSILVGQGLRPIGGVGDPRERWQWVTGGLAAAGGLWVSTCLTVTSPGNAHLANALLIGVGLAGGATLGASHQLAGWLRRSALVVGTLAIVAAGVVIPLTLG